ncbi:EAL domain-containing protein [Noviherbaspirillum sp. UKPF54]|uniref:sensor domain-containing protein n=1 Tax=Noviherbaspirillum sp. UKPF54 TaxID=2601898 RepID=UPI0011B14AA6|nr:EAL domain-containing protein [Noviherbaspirillum sp. UKPF54]QDZ26605.1 EAL domain-containing protein [Noviherbaspirillum sp. UKPF54]
MNALIHPVEDAADGELATTQRRLAELINSIDGIVWEADPATFRFTFVSARAEHILGYAVDEWYAEGFWPAHIHPDDRTWAVDYCAQQSREGADHAFEYRMITRDGRVVWLKDSVSLRMSQGQAVALCGIMVDISEQKLAQQAAAEHTHFLEQLGDTIPSPIFWKDAKGRYRGCNKAFEAYIGIARYELLGKTVYDIAPRNLAEVYEAADQALFASRGVQTYEAGVRYHDGSRHDVAFYKATYTQKDGSPGGLVGVMLDITERKRAEEDLKLSSIVFENSAQGIIITDAEKCILTVNRSFCAITGYEPQEVIGKTPAILQSGRQDDAFYQKMWSAIHENGHWSGEMWNRRKSGEVFAEHLSITRVLNAKGAVANYIGIFSDISQFKDAQHQIERLSFYDALTGLPNRALLRDRLQHAISNAERNRWRVALLAIDIDRLAHINDSLGHHIGDRLLIAVGERLQGALRGVDTLSRHIGDEFAVITEGLPEPQVAADLAERLRAELARVFVLDGHEVSISACIGISVYPEDGNTPDMLLKNADVALHHAKGAGGGCFQFFREEMNHASMERLLIESSLHQAVQRNELRVYYQPQVDLETGRIIGMEALVRWLHPHMGMVSPARFIPIAEETGQIIEIGRWVLREACAQNRIWNTNGFPDLRVAVNVSAQQLNREDFASQVKQVLNETGLAPDRLELELTESMIMQRTERVVGVISELRNIGVKFSIDDFGTGYSSLAQLNRFPIDKLKIDQSFTREIGSAGNGTAITCAIIALARSLNLLVIAEGVETDEQQRFLVENGCDGMQGYLFSRPLPAGDFSALLFGYLPRVAQGTWQID